MRAIPHQPTALAVARTRPLLIAAPTGSWTARQKPQSATSPTSSPACPVQPPTTTLSSTCPRCGLQSCGAATAPAAGSTPSPSPSKPPCASLCSSWRPLDTPPYTTKATACSASPPPSARSKCRPPRAWSSSATASFCPACTTSTSANFKPATASSLPSPSHSQRPTKTLWRAAFTGSAPSPPHPLRCT